MKCWIWKRHINGCYNLHTCKPRWYRSLGWMPRTAGPRYSTLHTNALIALLGDEWELPEAGELLEVEDGVPTWVYYN